VKAEEKRRLGPGAGEGKNVTSSEVLQGSKVGRKNKGADDQGAEHLVENNNGATWIEVGI